MTLILCYIGEAATDIFTEPTTTDFMCLLNRVLSVERKNLSRAAAGRISSLAHGYITSLLFRESSQPLLSEQTL